MPLSLLLFYDFFFSFIIIIPLSFFSFYPECHYYCSYISSSLSRFHLHLTFNILLWLPVAYFYTITDNIIVIIWMQYLMLLLLLITSRVNNSSSSRCSHCSNSSSIITTDISIIINFIINIISFVFSFFSLPFILLLLQLQFLLVC